MVDDSNSEVRTARRFGSALGVATMVAGGVAIFASSGLAAIATAIAFSCLAGSILIDQMAGREECTEPDEQPWQRAAIAITAEDVGISQESQPGKCWTRTIAEEKRSCRHR